MKLVTFNRAMRGVGNPQLVPDDLAARLYRDGELAAAPEDWPKPNGVAVPATPAPREYLTKIMRRPPRRPPAASAIAAMLSVVAALMFSPFSPSRPARAQTASLTHASSQSLGTSLVVEANPNHVLSAFGCTAITGGAAGFCVAYSGATVPGTGALTAANVIDYCWFPTTAQGCSFSRIPLGAIYQAGIVILLTSAASPFTYTTGTDTGALWADYN